MLVLNFHSGLKKKSIIWKIWNFHPGLKFHLELAKPSWIFKSVYRVEIFTSLAEMKFQLGIPTWNFNPGWKSPYNQPLNLLQSTYCNYSKNGLQSNCFLWLLQILLKSLRERASGGSLFIILHYSVLSALICFKVKLFDKLWELPFNWSCRLTVYCIQRY